MQVRAVLFSLCGIVVAGGSVWLTSSMIPAGATAATAAPAAIEFAQVLVAKEHIAFGEIIERDSLAAQRWPVGSVPDGAFISTRTLLGPEGAGPRRAIRAIASGGLILDANISNFGESVSMVDTLGVNTRAMSIEVDAVTGVGGFVLPGDRVDIVLTEGRGEQLRTATILQGVRVLSVDQDDDEPSRARTVARTLTVEVSPRDGQILALGQRAGTLSLTLRTIDQVRSDQLEQISLDDILVNAAPDFVPTQSAQPAVANVPVRTIRVRRGVVTEDVVLK